MRNIKQEQKQEEKTMKRSELNTLTIEPTKNRNNKAYKGKGFVLYGYRQEYGMLGEFENYGAWIERWFPTKEKAINYCVKYYQTFTVNI
jgi:hypothetical protein